MSKVGKKQILLPEDVKVTLEGESVCVQGSLGSLQINLPQGIKAQIEKNKLSVTREDDSKKAKSLHGAIQRNIANAITGVSQGWKRKLELVGAGYRARVEGKNLVLSVGFSHTVQISQPEAINFDVQENIITVSGPDKHIVGQTAANIRRVRPPEPYKGKGIKYQDEILRRKAGKAAKTGATA